MTTETRPIPHRPWWRKEGFIPAALLVFTVAWMLLVEGRQGIGRDEAQYFRASERYYGFFESVWTHLREGHPTRAFTKVNVDAYFDDNHEHPPLMKILYGLSWRAFHTCDCHTAKRGLHPIPIRGKHVTLPLFKRESTAFRFPAMLMAGLGAALVYWLSRRMLSPWPSGVAAVLSVAQPHYFFHAQIACFDVPITVMAALMVLAYWKSLRSPRWGILCGLIWGLALATKHNAWLMPFFLLLHYLWIRRGDWRRWRPPRIPLCFVSMATLGPIVLFIVWPWLWHAPVTRAQGWVVRHTQHEHYNFEYLGQNWNLPPKELPRKLLRVTFPVVSAGLTLPVTTMALFVVGTVVFLRRRKRAGTPQAILRDEPMAELPRASWIRPGADVDLAPGMLFAIHMAGPVAIVALPSTPIFGGVKHFMPAMPFFCVVAGAGAAWLLEWGQALFAESRLRKALPGILATCLCLPAVAETQRSHPDGLGHYNLLAGGFAGGANLGMNRQFWGYSVLPLLPWMTAHRPPSNRIYWHDVLHDSLVMYMREGRLPLGIGNVGVGEQVLANSDLGIIIWEKHFVLYDVLALEAYHTTRPVRVYSHEGVPFVIVYERRPVTEAGMP
jgi:hypothetical protein